MRRDSVQTRSSSRMAASAGECLINGQYQVIPFCVQANFGESPAGADASLSWLYVTFSPSS